MPLRTMLIFFVACVLQQSVGAGELDMGGELGAQWRWFAHTPQFREQQHNASSVSVKPRGSWASESGDDIISVELFGRIDKHDADRTHFDVREFLWDHVAENWSLRAGIGIVFWGVTESQHLIDIINQTNALEGVDGEDKLGQAMVNFSTEREFGVFDLFVLPGFRARRFTGSAGRLRPEFRISDDATYESSSGKDSVDLALRWSHYIDIYDFALSHFHGIQREPMLIPRITGTTVELTPYYPNVSETSFMLQATLDSWLWKLETKHANYQSHSAWMAVGGFEFSLYDIWEKGADLGIISEFHYDDRGASGSTLQNDIMLGARLALNDAASSELLVGGIVDLDDDARWISLEASRRIGNDWKVEIEIRAFSNMADDDPLGFLTRDDFLQLEISHYF